MASDTLAFRNDLLASLPPDELDQLRPNLHPATFVFRQVVHEVGSPLDDVFFPESGLISLTADTSDTGLVEVGMTGREGFVGTAVLLNPQALATHQAIVQLPGTGHRMRAPLFREALATMPSLQERCLRYVQFVMMQGAQSAACNARHELPERLARWLLMSRDRADDDEMPMTQEFLSYMLGVRRAGVSVVASALQSTGVIRLSRGHVTVLDRPGLEQEACSCYRMIEDSRRSIMG